MKSKLSDRLKQEKFQGPAHEAFLNLMVASYHLRMENEKICKEFGVTLPQYNILRILRGVYPGGHPRSEIISRMIEPAPDVTRIIDRLLEKKLIIREEGKEDRRQSIATISPSGLDLLKKMDKFMFEMDLYLGEKLTQEELKQLSALCEKIHSK